MGSAELGQILGILLVGAAFFAWVVVDTRRLRRRERTLDAREVPLGSRTCPVCGKPYARRYRVVLSHDEGREDGESVYNHTAVWCRHCIEQGEADLQGWLERNQREPVERSH